MYQSVTINNFRCFGDFTIAPLGQVNLMIGSNSVGKTALLEAIFLLTNESNIHSIQQLSDFRFLRNDIGSENQFGKWFWTPLFHKLDTDSQINIQGQAKDNSKCHTNVSVVPHIFARIPLNNKENRLGERLSSLSTKELQIEYTDFKGEKRISRMFFENGSIRVEQQQSLPSSVLFLTAHRGQTRIFEEDARLFGEMIVRQEPYDLLAALKIVAPQLKRLTPIPHTSGGIIYGDIGLEQMLPLPLLGEGLSHLMTIMLRIASTQHGILLIDEIENGLHYSTLTKIWAAIGKAARDFDVQIFATTHSWECIRAAHEAFMANDVCDFRLHRLEKVKDEIKAITYDQDAINTSIEMNWEMR
jgi:AAA15 family ATPase/GTPase